MSSIGDSRRWASGMRHSRFTEGVVIGILRRGNVHPEYRASLEQSSGGLAYGIEAGMYVRSVENEVTSRLVFLDAGMYIRRSKAICSEVPVDGHNSTRGTQHPRLIAMRNVHPQSKAICSEVPVDGHTSTREHNVRGLDEGGSSWIGIPRCGKIERTDGCGEGQWGSGTVEGYGGARIEGGYGSEKWFRQGSLERWGWGMWSDNDIE
ncbi:hypothetical protein C8F01DRAFT_1084455 [Mycena amicta]|nr:hypothetical protein C8F01DRAFT_1084455 [Mycena amicta]